MEDVRANVAADMPQIDHPAVILLRNYLSDLAVNCYHAGWVDDHEEEMWEALERGGGLYGEHALNTEDIAVLRWLNVQAGGWVQWDERRNLPVFRKQEAWDAHYARWQAQRQKGGGSRAKSWRGSGVQREPQAWKVAKS